MAKIRPSIFAFACALFLATVAQAEQTLRSRSGQFVVMGLPTTVRLLSHTITNPVDYVRLDPAALTVTCERIKEALLTELELPDAWQGLVQLRIFPVRQDNEPVRVTTIRYRDGWSYAVEVPEWIMRQRLVAAITQAVLTEIANRKARKHAAELPIWLLEGMSAYLLANNRDDLILEPATRIIKRHQAEDSIAPIREALRKRSALTLDQLSWPREDADEQYTHCAHLFVHELLHLSGGRKDMAEMVAGLAQNLNWQITFLAAFKGHFRQLIDVDKWWALTVAHITGRDPMSVWPLDQTLAQLDQTLATPVQLRVKTGELPGTTRTSLQRIINEWDDRQQDALMTQKISQLQALRLRSPPETLEMIDAYMLALQNRLRKRASKPDTIRRLNELDAQRLKFNPPQAAPADR